MKYIPYFIFHIEYIHWNLVSVREVDNLDYKYLNTTNI